MKVTREELAELTLYMIANDYTSEEIKIERAKYIITD